MPASRPTLGRETALFDPALRALAEWQRLCAEYNLDRMRASDPDPACAYWEKYVVTARPVTYAGAIALLEETVQGAEQPDLIQNVITFLRWVAPKDEWQPVRDVPGEPEPDKETSGVSAWRAGRGSRPGCRGEHRNLIPKPRR